MRHHLLILILLGLFIIEGSIIPIFIPEVVWNSEVRVDSQFVFVIVLYIALFENRHVALTYGLIFGLLQDMYYGHMLGSTSFCMGLSAYLSSLVFQHLIKNMIMSLIMMICGIFFFELLIYGVHQLFKISVYGLNLEWALVHHILPSMMLNVLFALLIYVPIRKVIEMRRGRMSISD